MKACRRAERASFSQNLFPIAFSQNCLFDMEKRDFRTCPIASCSRQIGTGIALALRRHVRWIMVTDARDS